jgi:hypothetical protein
MGLALAFASTSALAFEEQGGAPVAPPTPEAQQPAAPSEKNLDYSAPTVDENAGTEVRIPGHGKLGVLPKMNFGLELLYGANEASKQAEPEPQAPASEDLTIRGTVKHNF